MLWNVKNRNEDATTAYRTTPDSEPSIYGYPGKMSGGIRSKKNCTLTETQTKWRGRRSKKLVTAIAKLDFVCQGEKWKKEAKKLSSTKI